MWQVEEANRLDIVVVYDSGSTQVHAEIYRAIVVSKIWHKIISSSLRSERNCFMNATPPNLNGAPSGMEPKIIPFIYLS